MDAATFNFEFGLGFGEVKELVIDVSDKGFFSLEGTTFIESNFPQQAYPMDAHYERLHFFEPILIRFSFYRQTFKTDLFSCRKESCYGYHRPIH